MRIILYGWWDIMGELDKQKLIEAAESTGYDLENYIYELLKSNGWQVINNRYYIDDLRNIEREIDLLAYKARIDNNQIIYYTVLIISCKKTKESIWTFLTRQRPENDPNTEYFLVENYSTDKRLAYMLKNKQEEIRTSLITSLPIKSLFEVDHIPFAFQQFNAKSYKSEDDKRIYDSIISTIKALEYEKENRGRPKIDNVNSYFYNFNLLSIFNGEMYEVFFNDGAKAVNEIGEIKYINRHIIGGKESFYKVHFITKECFELQIGRYNKLHQKNKLYMDLVEDFFKEIFNDQGKVDIFWKDFCKEIDWWFNYTLISKLGFRTDNRADDFSFDYENVVLNIHFDGYYNIDDPNFLEKVNNDEGLKRVVENLLIKFFRYKGKFMFDNNYLPF